MKSFLRWREIIITKKKESEIIIYEDNNINDSIVRMISCRLILIHYHRS
jgi:hypothetical protein